LHGEWALHNFSPPIFASSLLLRRILLGEDLVALWQKPSRFYASGRRPKVAFSNHQEIGEDYHALSRWTSSIRGSGHPPGEFGIDSGTKRIAPAHNSTIFPYCSCRARTYNSFLLTSADTDKSVVSSRTVCRCPTITFASPLCDLGALHSRNDFYISRSW
jgi:hypothetical protein